MNNLVTLLNGFWASKINNFNINLNEMSISISIEINETDIVSNHTLVFDGVVSFFYKNNDLLKQKPPFSWEYAELSEIYFLPKGSHTIKHHQVKGEAPQYSANPNFFLEIWSSALFIDAKRLTIDGKPYELIG